MNRLEQCILTAVAHLSKHHMSSINTLVQEADATMISGTPCRCTSLLVQFLAAQITQVHRSHVYVMSHDNRSTAVMQTWIHCYHKLFHNHRLHSYTQATAGQQPVRSMKHNERAHLQHWLVLVHPESRHMRAVTLLKSYGQLQLGPQRHKPAQELSGL